MKQNPRRYISHIVLLCILAVLFCACAKQTEYGEPFTEVTGQPTVTEPGISAALEDNKPTDVTVDAPEKADEKEESAPTPTGVPTGTPAPIITDPYDGRFWTGKYAEDTALLLTKAQIAEQNEKNFSATGTKLVTLSKRTVYTAGEILEMIEAYSLPSRKYFDNREFGASEKERLQQERNLSVLRENPAGEIILRARRGVDAMRLPGGTRSLKKLFIDRKIPAARRGQIPILCDDLGIIGIPGISVNLDRAAKALPATTIKFHL